MSVTVTCPECGAKLKLKSRASLGKERPCPKCEVPFVLSEEYNDSVYDLDARGAAPSRSSRADSEEPKMLKRGSAEKRQTARDEGRPTRGGNGSSLDFSNRPLAIGLGAGGLISAGMLLAWLVMGGGGDPAPSPDQETVSDSGITQGETAGGSSVANPRSGVPRRTGENPIPGREPPRTQPIGQTVDLLAGVNVSRNKVSGNWDLTAGRLQSSDGDAKLQLPVEPPGDYRFEATVTREAGDEQINIILPVGDDRQVMFVADWIGSGACGLEAVNGQPPGEGNPTRAQYPMENNQNYRIHAEVRRDAGNVHIQAGIDGGNLVDWKGPVSQLSIFGGWAIPSKNAIGLASGSGRNAGTFVSFREVRLTNLGGSNSSSNPPLVASNTNPTTSQPTTPNIPQTTKPREPEPLPSAIPLEPVAVNIDFTPDESTYSDVVRPFLQKNCVRCHGADTQEGNFRVDDELPNDFIAKVNVDRWSEVLNMLNAGEMPPEGEPRPSLVEVTKVVEWIEHERLRAEIARNDRRVVLRRMNQHEYNNTIRDLVGVNFNPGDQFPEDPPAAGFDNNGGALTISPLHMEMYLKAAHQILERVMPSTPPRKPIKWRFNMPQRLNLPDPWISVPDQFGKPVPVAANARTPAPLRNNLVVLERPSWDRVCSLHHFFFPGEGEYVIRVRAAQWQPSRQDIIEIGVKHRGENYRKHFETDRAYHYGPPRMKIRTTMSNDVLDTFDVPAPENAPEVYEIRAHFPRKARAQVDGIQVSSVYTIDSVAYDVEANQDFPYPRLLIDWIELEGPFWDGRPKQRILFDSPNRGNEAKYAAEVLSRFMTRAYRRPVTDVEVQRRLALFQKVRPNKASFEEAIKVPLMAVLSSPHFLYLVEPESFNAEPKATAQSPDREAVASGSALNNYELASRLSYFLWSSMPDDELFALAEQGKLTDPQTLASQVDRMLADKRSEAFVKNFSGQWLGTRQVGSNRPARQIFARYDDHLELSFIRETEAFFAHILKNDWPVTDFIRSDYVLTNERLARFYGIPGIRGDHMRVVQPPAEAHRGGVLTQGTVLSVTSNGTRTSPVWRGVWILENLLDDPPPPPPPNAGDIPPAKEDLSKVSLRKRLRLHRNNPQCARCHNKIDPLGFALEKFDTAGGWRTVETKGRQSRAAPDDPVIDANAQLPDGTRFSGIEGLQRELLKRREQFYACLARKLMIYALGRDLGFGDQEFVDQAVVAMRADPTLRILIKQIVSSDLFLRK